MPSLKRLHRYPPRPDKPRKHTQQVRLARAMKHHVYIAWVDPRPVEDVGEREHPYPFGASFRRAARMRSDSLAFGISPAACATADAASDGA